MNKIEVSPNIWQWVLRTGSLTMLKSDLKNNFDKWFRREDSPTFNQLEKFSNATRIPLGYFFLKTPPVEKCAVLEYRTVDSVAIHEPSRDLRDTVRHMENTQEWMRNYLIDSGSEPVAFVGSLNLNGKANEIANTIRGCLSLNKTWYRESKDADASFKRLRSVISNVGVLVMLNGTVGGNTHRPLDLNEFRAFTLIDDYAPLIFINAVDSKNGKLFSLLHEFIHVGMAKGSLLNTNDWNNVNPIETLCNAAAAEILVPMDQFIKIWGKFIGDIKKKVEEAALFFRCGHMVIARRALDNRFISNEDYIILSNHAKQLFNQNKGSGGDYYKTGASRIDRRFLFAVEASLKEGRTSYTDAYRLTNTNRNTFDNLVDEVRRLIPATDCPLT